MKKTRHIQKKPLLVVMLRIRCHIILEINQRWKSVIYEKHVCLNDSQYFCGGRYIQYLLYILYLLFHYQMHAQHLKIYALPPLIVIECQVFPNFVNSREFFFILEKQFSDWNAP